MPGASAHIEENPNTDPLTVARSRVAVFETFVADSDDELERLDAKYERTRAQADDVLDAINEAHAQRDRRIANLADAHAELAALEEGN